MAKIDHDFEYWFEKGNNSTDPDEKIFCYTMALELWTPDDSEKNKALVYYNRGRVFDEIYDFDSAIEDYNEAIKLNPRYVDAYKRSAMVYLIEEDLRSAIDDLTIAIALAPEDAYAYAWRGVVYMFMKKYDEAISDFTKAIELNPEKAVFYRARQSAYFKKGDLETAFLDFDKFTERLGPGFVGLIDIPKDMSLFTWILKHDAPDAIKFFKDLRKWINRLKLINRFKS